MEPELSKAACLETDPRIFDHYVYPEAREALTVCSRCTVVAACMNWVRPSKSYFDGVAAGIVWRNGYRVRPDNSTREDRIIRLRAIREGKNVHDTTQISAMAGQRTLPFD